MKKIIILILFILAIINSQVKAEVVSITVTKPDNEISTEQNTEQTTTQATTHKKKTKQKREVNKTFNLRPIGFGFGAKVLFGSISDDMEQFIANKYANDDLDETSSPMYQGLSANMFIDLFPIKYINLHGYAEIGALWYEKEDNSESATYSYPFLRFSGVGFLPGLVAWPSNSVAIMINFGPAYKWLKFDEYNAKGMGYRFRFGLMFGDINPRLKLFFDVDSTFAKDEDNDFEIGANTFGLGLEILL
jgi:hypothetical protein